MNEFEEWWKDNVDQIAHRMAVVYDYEHLEMFKQIAKMGWDAVRVGEYDGVIPPRSDK